MFYYNVSFYAPCPSFSRDALLLMLSNLLLLAYVYPALRSSTILRVPLPES